ncbi:MAG TPA: tetratricopeptide repeat protein [Pseudomonadota bacterium]|nr:tetratricopeptide repeat protein [Pseudomonadota bacterium]
MYRPSASPTRWLIWLALIAIVSLTSTARADEPSAPSPAAPGELTAPAPPSPIPTAPTPSPGPGGPTSADPAAGTTMPGGAVMPAQLSLKELTEQGIRQFQGGQFDAAVESFSAAHVLNPNPMFLFNIAQAHRKAGRPREALTHYQLFLRKAPESPLRPETEAYIALVQTQLQAQASPPLPSKPAQDLQSGVEHGGNDANPTPPRPTPVYKRGWFYGVLLGGAAAVALAVGLSVYVATRPPATTLGIVDPVF